MIMSLKRTSGASSTNSAVYPACDQLAGTIALVLPLPPPEPLRLADGAEADDGEPELGEPELDGLEIELDGLDDFDPSLPDVDVCGVRDGPQQSDSRRASRSTRRANCAIVSRPSIRSSANGTLRLLRAPEPPTQHGTHLHAP